MPHKLCSALNTTGIFTLGETQSKKCPLHLSRTITYQIFIICLLMLATMVRPGQTIFAQEAQGFWAEQQQIPDYDLDSFAPTMVVDSAGTVHAFSVERPFAEAPQDLFHRTWTPETGWSDPNNVVLVSSPFPPSILGVYMDEHDTIHLTLYVGNQDVADMYYTSSPAVTAHLATSWCSRRPLSRGRSLGHRRAARRRPRQFDGHLPVARLWRWTVLCNIVRWR
ncbi:MAG: hypothetical protein R3A44_32895 [Caldilineaceae bacterium]